MSRRTLALGAAVLVWSAPAAAQQRGTVELGAFGSATSFDNSLALRDGAGAGLRVGAFLSPRFSLEFDGSGTRASRPAGFRSTDITSISARMAFTPTVVGRTTWILSAGAVHTDYGVSSSYGMSGLIGAKLALGSSAALRLDAIADYMPHRDDVNLGLRAGVSFFRSPFNRQHTITVAGPRAPTMLHQDSVSAVEQRRLRTIAAAYRALRDSLAGPRVTRAPLASSSEALATMHEMIHFASDSSILSDASKATLDAKLRIFRANPAMRIVIVGNTDERATDAYNLALGGRRADAAKEYLVSRGIDPIRIEVASRGESQPFAPGTSLHAQAQNRRAEFRLLMASDYLVPPLK